MNLKRVWRVLNREFKGKAINSNRMCQYLTMDGRKCAIGCFIPDDHAAQSNDGDVMEILDVFPDLLKEMPCQNKRVLSEFQSFHDRKLDTFDSVDEQRTKLFKHYVKLCKTYKVDLF